MFLTDNKLLKSLMSCEPESLYALSDIPVSETEFLTISTLADLYDRELVSTIGWAKQIPGAVPSFTTVLSSLLLYNDTVGKPYSRDINLQPMFVNAY